jgi:hypothetical protein
VKDKGEGMIVVGATDYSRDYEATLTFADENNLNVVLPTSNELFCDLDKEDDLNRFLVTSERLKKEGILSAYRFETSKSGNWHGIATTVKEYSLPEKIALQAILGSDRRREYAAFVAYTKGEVNAVRRFTPKVKDDARTADTGYVPF